MKIKKCYWGEVVFILVILTCIAIISSILAFNYVQAKQAKQQAEIEKMYERQNVAFAMERKNYYKSYKEVDVAGLVERLAAYTKETRIDHDISPKDIEAYLANEYDSDGKLAVLNPPEKIKEYITWYSMFGNTYLEIYTIVLNQYLWDHADQYDATIVSDMTAEEMTRLIEDFNNCPDLIKYDRMLWDLEH